MKILILFLTILITSCTSMIEKKAVAMVEKEPIFESFYIGERYEVGDMVYEEYEVVGNDYRNRYEVLGIEGDIVEIEYSTDSRYLELIEIFRVKNNKLVDVKLKYNNRESSREIVDIRSDRYVTYEQIFPEATLDSYKVTNIEVIVYSIDNNSYASIIFNSDQMILGRVRAYCGFIYSDVFKDLPIILEQVKLTQSIDGLIGYLEGLEEQELIIRYDYRIGKI